MNTRTATEKQVLIKICLEKIEEKLQGKVSTRLVRPKVIVEILTPFFLIF